MYAIRSYYGHGLRLWRTGIATSDFGLAPDEKPDIARPGIARLRPFIRKTAQLAGHGGDRVWRADRGWSLSGGGSASVAGAPAGKAAESGVIIV